MTLHAAILESHADRTTWDGRCNEAGRKIIKYYEGLKDGDPGTPDLEPYRDPDGVPTIGWGSTWDLNNNRVTMTTPPVTIAEAEFLLSREIGKAEKGIKWLARVNLDENQFSALVSFTYNVGSGRFQSSTLRQKLNRGDYDGASAEFPKWRRSGGIIRRGLVRRRIAERELFDGITL